MTKTLDFNITKQQRKALATAIGEYVQEAPVYCGAPTFAYKIDNIRVDKDGLVHFPDIAEQDFEIENFLAFLVEKGFVAAFVYDDEPDEAPEAPAEEATPAGGISISMPRQNFTDAALENLKRLIDSKAGLLKTALGAQALPLEITDEAVSFPWFKETSPEAVKAYTHLVTALCEMAIHAKRVTAVEKAVENEKYAFRCFLLRLGFIGTEFKDERKVLLRNLSGSSAFKNGGATNADAE